MVYLSARTVALDETHVTVRRWMPTVGRTGPMATSSKIFSGSHGSHHEACHCPSIQSSSTGPRWRQKKKNRK